MHPFETIFWASFLILFFCYLGYGGLLYLLNAAKSLLINKKTILVSEETIPVTMIVASYNEAAILALKIKNTIALKYPPGFLEIIFVVDGSTDDSREIIRACPSIQLISLEKRMGKSAAINAAMKQVRTPVVVFSDANAMLNEECLLNILPHYYNPKVGGVAGEKKVITKHRFSALGKAEGLYWKYESCMKKLDAAFYTVVGAAGELYSVRTSLFKTLNQKLILDDFFISVRVCLQGFTIDYEPSAFATEAPSISLKEEEKRKIRIAAGAYQSIGYLKEALNFFKYPRLSFQYFFRRLLRWTICPLLLVALFGSNLILVAGTPGNNFFLVIFFLQILFYLLAIAGWLRIMKGMSAGLTTILFYFVFMNYCQIRGFIAYFSGRQTVLWEKSFRET